jgi:hypothetical protein
MKIEIWCSPGLIIVKFDWLWIGQTKPLERHTCIWLNEVTKNMGGVPGGGFDHGHSSAKSRSIGKDWTDCANGLVAGPKRDQHPGNFVLWQIFKKLRLTANCPAVRWDEGVSKCSNSSAVLNLANRIDFITFFLEHNQTHRCHEKSKTRSLVQNLCHTQLVQLSCIKNYRFSPFAALSICD